MKVQMRGITGKSSIEDFMVFMEHVGPDGFDRYIRAVEFYEAVDMDGYHREEVRRFTKSVSPVQTRRRKRVSRRLRLEKLGLYHGPQPWEIEQDDDLPF